MVQFFEDLAENTTKAGIRLRICFSSRPYPYISIRKGISLTLEAESGHVEDLAQYVKSKLTIEDPVLLADLQSEILGKASGIFLWIVLVVDILNKEDDDGGLALRTKLSTIPDKLSDLFRSILIRDRKSPERLLLYVLWILCAKRPLTPEEFRHALWVALLDHKSEQKDCQVDSNIPDVKNMNTCVKLVTSSSKGLAEITKAGRPIVQFVHESVRDFLVKERGLQDLWPELGFGWEGSGHERLRRCCTQYLSLSGVQAIVNGPEDRAARDTLAQKYSFLEYASQHVLHHSNIAALVMPNPQDDFLSQFFASGGIGVLNLFEGHKARRYGVYATPLYVLADKGLENLIRIQMKQESAKKESAAYTRGERYKYPFFTALANSHKGAVAALLGLSSSIHDGVDITEGFNYRKDLTGYQGRTPLSWAAQEGRLNIVKLLIRGADLDGIDERGYTPLRRALEKGQEAVARLLIDKGADFNAQNKYRSTPLIKASEDSYEAVARLLIEKGADVNAQNKDGRTALISALEKGYEAVARFLIEKGADVNAQDSSGWTALIWASQNSYEAVARLLIEKGANVNAQNNYRSTALILALQNGYEAVARLLIEKGANVNAQNNSGWTALIWALQNGYEAVARLLIDKGADVNIQNNSGSITLIWASENGYEAVARFLIDNGADVNAQNSSGSTPLIKASQNGHEAVARFLIDKGADVNAQDSSGSTPLIKASQNGYEAVARLLIEKGADVNIQNNSGSTALIWASENGHEAVARFLIEKGADVNAQNSSRSTPLIKASQNGHEAVARLLIDKGADFNVQSKYGSTPLIKASEDGQEAVARLLIEKGADVNAQDSSGSTALILASQNGHEAVERLLIDNRADVKSQNKQA